MFFHHDYSLLPVYEKKESPNNSNLSVVIHQERSQNNIYSGFMNINFQTVRNLINFESAGGLIADISSTLLGSTIMDSYKILRYDDRLKGNRNYLKNLISVYGIGGNNWCVYTTGSIMLIALLLLWAFRIIFLVNLGTQTIIMREGANQSEYSNKNSLNTTESSHNFSQNGNSAISIPLILSVLTVLEKGVFNNIVILNIEEQLNQNNG